MTWQLRFFWMPGVPFALRCLLALAIAKRLFRSC